MRRVDVRCVYLLCLTFLIAACGGGGDGGGTSSAAPTYTVAGTVSGLDGTGLLLQINAGNDLAVSANGAFTFSNALPAGTSYSVTVKTQPAGKSQNCVVSNGSGTMGSANVTNVAVTCGTLSFVVGGSVSGLSGAGLVLRNNNGDDLVINASGAFAFATVLQSGATYNVTVQTQPTAQPQQVCTASGTNGTVTTSAITTVVVTCRARTAKFVYVANAADNSVSGYAISATTGALTPLAGSPFAGPSGVPSLVSVAPVLSPDGRFLYLLGGVPAVGTSVAASTAIIGYQINTSTGQLTALNGFPVLVPAFGNELRFEATGKFAYLRGSVSATNTARGIYGFQLNSTSGALAAIAGSPFATPSPTGTTLTNNVFALSADGKFLFTNRFVTTFTPFIDTYGIDATTGALTLVTSTSTLFNVIAAQTDPSGKFLVVVANGGDLQMYQINGTNGQLTLSSVANTGGSIPSTMVFNPSGAALYVANAGYLLPTPPATALVPGPGSIASYTLNSVAGTLTGASGSPNATGGNTSSFPVIDALDRYLMVSNFDSGTVALFKVNATTHALTAATGSPIALSSGNAPGIPVFDPSANFLYVVDRTLNTISTYAVNPANDSLSFVASQPTGNKPSGLPVYIGLQ